jgi:DNA-binding SARP family transcriptional activator/streptogramin lyase
MEFRILGPLEVVDDGRPVSIRRGKEQALLAYLLLHANEIVPSGRLIDALWDERPPATASKILQNAVSHLRKELGEGRLLTRDPGYVLRVEKDELDVQRFEQLAKEGRGEEALALWRGTPLLGLRDERFADDARRHLEEQRLAVLEDKIEADLAAGHHAEVIPQLEHLVRENPLRERLQGQLMRALYGAGRQADALDAYRRARKTLSEDLGLEPDPQLQELERRILVHDPELAAPQSPRRVRREIARGRSRALLILAVVLLAGAVFAVVVTLSRGDPTVAAKQNSLAVIDPAHNRVVDVVPLGTVPRGIGVSPAGVWIANPRTGTVTWLNPKTRKIIQTIGLGAEAIDVATGAGGVWIVTGNDDTLIHLDARTSGLQETIRLPKDDVSSPAWSVAFGGGSVWASSGGFVAKINPASGSVAFKNNCCHGAFDVAFGFGALWVADFGTHVGVVSGSTGLTTDVFDIGLYTDSVITGYGFVWVSVTDNRGQHAALLKIDPVTRRTLQTIPLDPPAQSHAFPLSLLAGEGSIWVADGQMGDVLRIDPVGGRIKRIHVGGKPWGLALGAGRLWITVN